MIQFTLVEHRRDRANDKGKPLPMRWPADFIAPAECASKDSRTLVFSGRYYPGKGREKGASVANTEARLPLVWLDYDRDNAPGTMDRASALYRGIDHVAYTTHGHQPAAERFRIALRCSREMSPDEYHALVGALAEQAEASGLPFAPESDNRHRLFYLHCHPPGGSPRAWHNPGEPLDVDAALEGVDIEPTPYAAPPVDPAVAAAARAVQTTPRGRRTLDALCRKASALALQKEGKRGALWGLSHVLGRAARRGECNPEEGVARLLAALRVPGSRVEDTGIAEAAIRDGMAAGMMEPLPTTDDAPPPHTDEDAPREPVPDLAGTGGPLAALAALADRVKAAAGDAARLKACEIDLLEPSFVADLAAEDGRTVSLAMAPMLVRGFTGAVRRAEKALEKAREGARAEASARADALRLEADRRRKERMMDEEWPAERTGPHPGVDAALARSRRGDPLAVHANMVMVLRMDPRWTGRFRLNLLGDVLEHDGQLVDFEGKLTSDVCTWLSRTYGLHFKPRDVQEGIYATAQANAYHPVREYLSALPAWDGEGRVARLLPEVLGLADSPQLALYQKYIRRFLVSAVARVMQPGCKVDTALIFTGEQGAKKSSFFKALFSARWFGDSPIAIGDKNAPIQLRSTWGYECAEMESLSKKTADEVKQFLSTSHDLFRNVYERNARAWPRHSVICGSTNKLEFLSDPTGSRRFWPVPVPDDHVIDVGRVVAWRDQLWAEALALYRRAAAEMPEPHPDCRWWFDRDEDRERAEDARQFETSDPWDDIVMGHVVTTMGKFTIADILADALKMPLDRMDDRAERRVGAILRRHGWHSKRARAPEGGRYVNTWVRSARAALPPGPKAKVAVAPWVPADDDGVPY